MNDSFKCLNCGSQLSEDYKINENTIICPFCGAEHVSKNNTNSTSKPNNNTYNKVNNYKLDRSKSNYVTINKNTPSKQKNSSENKLIFRATLIGLAIFIIICIAVSLSENAKEEKINAMHAQGKYSIGNSEDYIDKNYKEVKASLELLGFTNIELVDLDESSFLSFNKNDVKTITIDGKSSFDDDDFFPLDSKIVIMYY